MNIVLGIVMLAAFALIVGAVLLWRRTGAIKQPALMVLLAVIAIANVMIWTLPDESGISPVEQIETAEQAEG